MRRASAALFAAALAPAVLAAQRGAWVDQLYPYAYYSTIDGFWLAGRYGWYSPMGSTEPPDPNFATIKLDAAASTKGSELVRLDAAVPAYWNDWRGAASRTSTRPHQLACS